LTAQADTSPVQRSQPGQNSRPLRVEAELRDPGSAPAATGCGPRYPRRRDGREWHSEGFRYTDRTDV